MGYLKPIILLPVASLNHLSTEQLEAVILHELAHIRRSDYIINMLVSVAEMVLFFNPFTRLLSRTIQKERENCCDDWVLQSQYNAGMYAEALLRIACLQQQQGFQMNAASQGKGELLQRVKRMVQPSQKKMGYRYQATAMMFIAALLFCIAWLQPNENDYHKPVTDTHRAVSKQMVIAPIIAQVDNPFFNGASLLSSSLHDDVMEQLAELDKTIADSAVTTGIAAVHKALKTVAPVIVSDVSPTDWQRMTIEALKNAGKSLEDTKESFRFTTDIPFADSTFLMQTVDNALAKTNYEKEMQKGLEAAGKELEKLQQSKAFSFSFSNLNGLRDDALNSLKNIQFEVMKDSLRAVSEKLKKSAQERIFKAEERRSKQALLIKQLQEKENKLIILTEKRSAINHLVLPSMPPAASVKVPSAYHDNAEDYSLDTNEPGEPQDASLNYSFSVPAISLYNNVVQYKAAKTIHITRSAEKGDINIVIEIRQ